MEWRGAPKGKSISSGKEKRLGSVSRPARKGPGNLKIHSDHCIFFGGPISFSGFMGGFAFAYKSAGEKLCKCGPSAWGWGQITARHRSY